MSIYLPHIQELLDDPAVTRLMVDGWQHVYVEKDGALVDVPTPFRNNDDVHALIHVLTGAVGARVDDKKPVGSLRLPDGTRVDVAIPPVSLIGPSLTLVKPPQQEIMLEDLLRFQTLTQPAADFLRVCVEGRLNIAVSGSAASGKQTILKNLARWIPLDERIVLLQNTGKLSLPHRRQVVLETIPSDHRGEGAVDMRLLVQSALRMRPDRIVVMELLGPEVADLIPAMNHGHDGCLFGMYSNGARDTISQLELMAGRADPELPLRALREQISSAVDLIVHMERLRDGTRKVVSITEVAGIENGAVALTDIFLFEQTGMEDGRITGHLRPTGLVPRFLGTLASTGIDLPSSIFWPHQG